MANSRRAERVSMGPGAVLSLNEAAQLLPLHDAEARQWLLDQGLVRRVRGRAVVAWASVLDVLAADPPIEAQARPARLPTKRVLL